MASNSYYTYLSKCSTSVHWGSVQLVKRSGSGKVRKDCIGDEGAESEGEALTCGHVLWVKERMRP